MRTGFSIDKKKETMTGATPTPGRQTRATNATFAATTSRSALVRSRWFILTWRVIIVVASITGVWLFSKSISGFFTELIFFTIQSNLFLAISITYAAWATMKSKSTPAPALKGGVTLYILITALVYNLLLAKPPAPDSIIVPLIGGALNSDLLHILTPIMAILDWLLFDLHGGLRWKHTLNWLSYPLAYLAFALIRGLFVSSESRYPYDFLNADRLGYGGVALNAISYGIAFWLLGLLLVALDRLLSRFTR
jgi:hypothetical protein